MTKKNNFAHKLLLSLNVSDFNLFFTWKLQPSLHPLPPPLKKVIPSKSWGPAKPPLSLKIWLEVQQPPSPKQKEGVHTMLYISIILTYSHVWNTVVMSGLVLLIATGNCWISYRNENAGLFIFGRCICQQFLSSYS